MCVTSDIENDVFPILITLGHEHYIKMKLMVVLYIGAYIYVHKRVRLSMCMFV